MRTSLSMSVAAAAIVLVRPAAADMRNADALFKAGKWPAARAAYEQLLPGLEGDELAAALNKIGYTYIRDGRKNDEAIAAFRKVLDLEGIDPKHRGSAQMRIGGAYRSKGEPEQGIVELRKVAQIEGAAPNTVAEAWLSAGWALGKLKRYDEAITCFQEVIEVDGASGYFAASGLYNIANTHERQKQYEDALAVFRRLLAHPGAIAQQKEEARTHVAELEAILAGDTPFYIRPYVSWVTQTSSRLFWVSLGDVPPGDVVLTDPAGGQVTVSAERSAVLKAEAFLHTAMLGNLTPGAVHSYTVRCGDASATGSFRTAQKDGPVTFAVLGDTQNAPDLHLGVAKAIAADDPDFVLHVGDLTDKGSSWGRWRVEFFDPGHPYMSKAPVWAAVGNHDGGPFCPQLFGFAHRQPMYYSFDAGNVHVVVIDSYWSGGRLRPKQLKWLEEDLASTPADWKIVSLHVPMMATRIDLKWWGFQDFRPIMEKHGVDVVFAGHHPMYRRYLPLGSAGTKPILHITSGGGGPVGDPVPSPLLVTGAGVQHHSFVRIEGNRLELSAKLPDGKVIDTLTLVKENGRYQDAFMASAVDPDLAHGIRHLYQELITDRTHLLSLEFESRPRPGQPVNVVLDLERLPRGAIEPSAFPDGTEIIVAQKPGCPWLVETQSVPLGRKRLVFEVTAPPELSVGSSGLKPRLELGLNVRVAERVFEPYVCRVIPTDASLKQFAANDATSLPVTWQFRLDPHGKGDAERWFAPGVGTEGWGKILINSWWEEQLVEEYDGVGWYRTVATAPPVGKGQKLWLEFGAIDETCWVYVNGRKAGEFIYDSEVDDEAWRKPKRFDITPFATAGENLLVVKVQDLSGKGGIYKGGSFRVE